MSGRKDVDRSRASGQDTRRRILAAAGELFAARGYEDVTVEYIRTGRAPLDETVTFIQD